MQFIQRGTAESWLPERLHDLIYRVGAQEADEGRARSSDYIFLWEDGGENQACVLPDGENVYFSIKNGCEELFPSMLAFSEEKCRQLFAGAEDGTVTFWVAISDSFAFARRTLQESGYSEYTEKEYMNCIDPRSAAESGPLPEGFRLLYGEEYPDEAKKWSAFRLGFHPDWEAPDYRAGMAPYHDRKRSSMSDSFECITVEENAPKEENNVCSYCYVYVDRASRSALIEPVSTREKYRRRGLGKAMLRGAVRRCAMLGVEKCYVDAFGWRKDFYTAAGFATEDSIGFWYKTLHPSGSD